METENSIRIAAPYDSVFELAARIENWPQFLPHYRYVNVLAGDELRRVVEMGAHRDGFPVRWVSIQEISHASGRIYFQHIGGATRGMVVEWRFTEADDEVIATIWHQFKPSWTRGGHLFGKYIVGDVFVSNIASKTLRCIKELAESSAQSGRTTN
jgi:uncharacterized membrane protein